MVDQRVAKAAQQALGLPQGFKTYSPFPFAGMNLQASAPAVGDTEFSWLENFLHIGDGYLRTAWDIGPSLYLALEGTRIVTFFFYTIGSNYYAAVFLSDGSAVQVDATTGATTAIGNAGTFYSASSGFLPDCSQWGVQYLLIVNRNTVNDYWIWDGILLYKAGTAAPNGIDILSGGLNYNTEPTVVVYGGSGAGLVVMASVQGGSVVELNITNPGTGYQIGDVVQLAFSGGGSDTSARLVALLGTGGVAAANVTAGGSGYSAATVAFSGGGGTGAAAVAVLSAGVVTNIEITDPGTGYTSAPAIAISGDGMGATATALLAPGGVAGVNVVDGGTGFTKTPLVSFVGGGGSGATATVLLTPTTVAYINVTAGGSGYTSAPTTNIIGGGGSGLAVHLILTAGQVTQVQVLSAGSGYTAPPALRFSGGGGSGAAAEVVLVPTSIARVLMSSLGQFYTSTPAVEIAAGANNSAYATATLMPFGVSGSAIETFQQRVLVFDPAPAPFSTTPPGGNFVVSAPESLVDFATSDGGLLFTNSDSFLQTRYTNAKQSNGYLYTFGDGSVSVISNIQTAGSPATTTFSNQNVDPQAGLSWRDACQDFGRSIVVSNETGVYGLYGGSVTKISSKLDQLFQQAVFPPMAGALVPTSATATLFNVKHYLQLMTITDPDTLQNRNIMVTWNEKDWTITSQSAALTVIGTQKVESKFTAWGTDGTNLYPLFRLPSERLSKRLDTKLYGNDRLFILKDLMAMFVSAQDRSAGLVGVGFSVAFAVSGMATQSYSISVPSMVLPNVLYAPPSFQAPPPAWPLFAVGDGGLPFVLCGVRLTSTSPDFVLGNIVLGYVELKAIFGTS